MGSLAYSGICDLLFPISKIEGYTRATRGEVAVGCWIDSNCLGWKS